MGFLDFIRSDEKRAASPEETVVQTISDPGENEGTGDELHRGMKPRQLSERPSSNRGPQLGV